MGGHFEVLGFADFSGFMRPGFLEWECGWGIDVLFKRGCYGVGGCLRDGGCAIVIA